MPLDPTLDEPDAATWNALRELLDANDAWRQAVQRWARSSHSGHGAPPRDVRDAERRVADARAHLSALGHPQGAQAKDWGAH